MKLSRETLAILKNFSNINSNLTIKPGNKLATKSVHGSITAEAVVSENFPSEFGIYDLSELLGVLSLFEDPELDFGTKTLTLKEKSNIINYHSADASILTEVKNIKQLPDPDIEFVMTANMLQQMQKSAAILKLVDMAFVGDGKELSVEVCDKTNPTGNTYRAIIGNTDKKFHIFMKVENLKMLPGDYTVGIISKRFCRLSNDSMQLKYYNAVEHDSTFDF